MITLHQRRRTARKLPSTSGKRSAPQTFGRIALAVCVLCSGCLRRDEPVTYPFHDSEIEYYKDVATNIEYPTVAEDTAEPVAFSQAPRTVLTRDMSEPWDMPLMEAVHTALQNNDVIRSAASFLSPGNSILANAQTTPSIYDPAINDSGVLFGNRGVEAALSAFDAQFTTNMVWGRNELIQNNPFFGGGLRPGATLTAETGNFFTGLQKSFANGGQVQVSQTINYQGSNFPNQLFPSNYSGPLQAMYRQPLLAGAGTEYTRIAGPITQSFGGLSGVTQGVVIARINSDISIADFQASVRNLVKDVQDTYWDLYLSYRNFDTAVTARNAALSTWRFAKIRVELGGNIDVADESQARDQYFAAQAAVENTRSNIFATETRLRRLMGLPVNEGRVIRPADEPITAEMIPDWQVSLTEALVNRVELRKQKWNIKSLDMQLLAARSLTRPRLDFVGGYQVNGFGNNLLGYNDDDGVTQQGLNSYYETITQGNQTGWSLGFQFNMPIGFRSAHAQVRNIELRLTKAHQVLYAQELEVAHELANAFQELARAYEVAQTQYNRRKAAIDNVSTIEKQVQGEIKTVDETLRAQNRRALAEIDFFTAVVDYNKALTNYQFRKGTLLQDTNVTLMEGGWDPEAYIDAYRHAQARTAAIDAPFMHAEPEEFSSAAPVGGVQFVEPLAPNEVEEPALHDEELAPMPADKPADTMPTDDVFDPLAPVGDATRPMPTQDGSASTDGIPTPAVAAPVEAAPVEAAPDALLRRPFDAASPHAAETSRNLTPRPATAANETARPPSSPTHLAPTLPAAPSATTTHGSGGAVESDEFWNLDPIRTEPPTSVLPIKPVPPAKPSAVPQAASDTITPIGYWHAVE